MKKKILTLLLMAVLIYFMYECPLRFVFGLPCPGCGMSRAFISLITLDFKDAFFYHPLFPLVIIIAVVYLLIHFGKIKITTSQKNIFLYTVFAIFFATYFIRLFGNSPIVKPDFDNSLFAHIRRLFN